MPLSEKERKLMQSLHKEYGAGKAKNIFEGMKTKAAEGKGPKGLFSKAHIEKRQKRIGY